MRFVYLTIMLFLCTLMLFSNEEIGEITLIEGDVTLSRDGTEVAAEAGDVLVEEDIIITAEGAAAEIELYESLGNVRVKESSQLSMAHFIGSEDTTGISLSLTFGSISNQVSSNESGSELYTVTTPTITLGVRGTGFDVVVTEIGDTLVEINEGEVVVGELDGSGEIYDDNYRERSGEMTLKKGEKVERLINGERIERREIERDKWRQERLEHFKGHPEETLLLLEEKIFHLHKRLAKLNRALFYIITLERKQGSKVSDYKNSIKQLDNLSAEKKAEVEKMLDRRSNKTSQELKHEMFKILKVSRLMLDEYHSSKRMIKNILGHIKRNKIEIKNKKAFALFLKRLEKIKEIDKDMMKFEHVWRSIVDRHRPPPKDRRRNSKDGRRDNRNIRNRNNNRNNGGNRKRR